MKILKQAELPFRFVGNGIDKNVKDAIISAPFEEPSYKSERRKSVWLIAEPDMKYGALPKFTPAWRNEVLENYIKGWGYDVAQLGITHYKDGGGINPHRDTTYAAVGMVLGINLCGEAKFYMWDNVVAASRGRYNNNLNDASLTVLLEDEDIIEFHGKYLHAGWSTNPNRITLNAWKVRDTWRDALKLTIGEK